MGILFFLAFWTLVPEENKGLSAERAPLTAPQVFRALTRAYPGKVQSPSIRDGEWSILINGRVFYWASGRILPKESRASFNSYSPHFFWRYPENLPPLRQLTAKEVTRIKNNIKKREEKRDARSQEFLIALWGMAGKDDAKEHIREITFLKRNSKVHKDIIVPLRRVEREILNLSRTDSATALWLRKLNDVSGYLWRDIAGSANRSLHSYGIAIDLIPNGYQGKFAYWRWAANSGEDWWSLPYSKRHQIPQKVIKAFEKYGFVWGGKWFLFDQIHFEYRPEIILLGGS